MVKNVSNNVTVIIPCYNDGAYVLEALQSIFAQTILPSKIYIVDDGSNIETKGVLRKINNDRVEILYQQNQGVCTARNYGINKATTKYILTLDADDSFENTFIEKSVYILDNITEVGVVCCFYKEFGEGVVNKDIIRPQGRTVTDFLTKNNGVASALFRKECWVEVGGYDTQFKNGYEDWDFWLSILRNSWKMEIIKEPLFNYRKKKSSRDAIAIALYDEELRMKIFKKHKDLYTENLGFILQQMIYKNNIAQDHLEKLQKGREYRLGHSLLLPIKLLKQLVRTK
ncbi:glycosyltransferase family 2 protein [Dokdonia sp. R86516]|uniref:glycosyltransferase family 2 protein n=1 Tax=Dokdonia sp. R86516 TaxID=3093856 RepID=UPI0037C8D3B1